MTVNEAKFQALVILLLYKREASLEEIIDFTYCSEEYYNYLCDLLYKSLDNEIVVGLDINGRPGLNETFVVLWDTTVNHLFIDDEDINNIIDISLQTLHKKIENML